MDRMLIALIRISLLFTAFCRMDRMMIALIGDRRQRRPCAFGAGPAHCGICVWLMSDIPHFQSLVIDQPLIRELRFSFFQSWPQCQPVSALL